MEQADKRMEPGATVEIDPAGSPMAGAVLRPVRLKKPVAAAMHPSWTEIELAAESSTYRRSGIDTTCQHGADVKPFTGRGAGRRQRQAQEDVDKLHAQMRQLADLTKTIKGRRIYLALHTRTATGQLSLRWRQVGFVEKTSHIPWRDLEQWLAPLDWALVQWYRSADASARDLNRREKEARAMLRSAIDEMNQHMEQQEMPAGGGC
jgi:hypothetical protein